MSLKTFHLIFISAAILLALFCGVWWILDYVREEAGILTLVQGLLALVVAVTLGIYERYFMKRLCSQAHL